MGNPNTIKLDNTEYVRADSINVKPTKKRIIILQRGWNVVGDFSQEGNQCTLTDSSVIRRWGTTKGIGELALNGPTSETKLDPCGTCRFHELNIIATLDIKHPENW
jgi:hypothetical protein